ncbi:MAG: response regulator [Candidatus Omnitrophota bacterium]
MRDEVHILIADDDIGHATLIRRNLKRLGLSNPVTHFKDGQEVLDYLFKRTAQGPHWQGGNSYVLLLDIRMPKVDGVEVLRSIKNDPELRKIPVIMITTTDDPRDIEQCHSFGCSGYIVKPVKYDKFVEAVQKLGLFFKVIEVPVLSEK